MSTTPALDAEYRKVIPGRYVTKRDGTPMHCNACAAALVAGQTFAATNSDGWDSYCASCAASFAGQIGGIYGRIGSLLDGLDPVPPTVATAIEQATAAVQAFAADPTSAPLFLTAKASLALARQAVNLARRDVRDANAVDLFSVPSGTYAVPGGDTRLKVKIDNVTKGKWAGWVFVKDGAEYGQGKRYGRQKPGGTYQGEITEALRVIAGDIAAAAAAYGHLTGRCTFCGLPLEDERSVSRGYGPTCATNHGLPWG